MYQHFHDETTCLIQNMVPSIHKDNDISALLLFYLAGYYVELPGRYLHITPYCKYSKTKLTPRVYCKHGKQILCGVFSDFCVI